MLSAWFLCPKHVPELKGKQQTSPFIFVANALERVARGTFKTVTWFQQEEKELQSGWEQEATSRVASCLALNATVLYPY